jgi:putative peptidoglycan lipid II flippase
MSERHGLLQSASLISFFTALSRVLGYFRDSRIAYLLGAGVEADAFNAAYRVANLLRRLVGEGAVSAAFVPVFSRRLAGGEGKREDAWRFADSVLIALTTTLLAVIVTGILAAPLMARLLLSGFAATPGKLELAVELGRVMFPYALFIGLAALAMGTLHSARRFGAPAFGPIVANAAIISVSFLTGFFSTASMALAVGVVVGGALHVASQVPALARMGWRPQWLGIRSAFDHPEVRAVARRMAPMIVAMGVVQINVLVGLQFAAGMEHGSVTAVSLADRVMELALGSYAVAISTAILPLLSHQAAEGRTEEMKSTMAFACRMALFITVPAGVGLAALRHPIIEVLFQHGAFDAHATALTARALLLFALGLPAFSMVKIVAPAFYAAGETAAPVFAALGSMILNVSLNIVLAGPLGSGGPALATSVSAGCNVAALMWLFFRRHGPFGFRAIGRSLGISVLSSALMAALAAGLMAIPGVYAGGLLQRATALVGAIGAGIAVYLGASILLGAREPGELRVAMRARLGGAERPA